MRHRRPMTAAQKKAVSVRMKAYWEKRRNGELPAPARKTRNGVALSNQSLARYAVMGARIRLQELEAERAEIQRFLKNG